jgi:hypothetical protein
MKTTLLLSLMIVAACSTPYELKRTDPIVTYISQKPAEDLKKCVFKSWRKQFPDVMEERTGLGWQVKLFDTLESSTVALTTIDGDGPTTNVNYYNRSKLRNHGLEEAVEACK